MGEYLWGAIRGICSWLSEWQDAIIYQIDSDFILEPQQIYETITHIGRNYK